MKPHQTTIHFNHERSRRCPIERIEDFLFIFNPFDNGVKKSTLMDLYATTVAKCKEDIQGCKTRGLIREKNGIYEKTNKGTLCNTLWYTIRDIHDLGRVKAPDEKTLESVISTILHVDPVPRSTRDKSIDRIIEEASNYGGRPTYPIPKYIISPIQKYVSILKLVKKWDMPKYSIKDERKKVSTSKIVNKFRPQGKQYEIVLNLLNHASARGHIKLHDPTKKYAKYPNSTITEKGIIFLKTLDWYLTTYKLVPYLPLRI